MTHFRVATYNVHKCKGMDGRTSPERIAKVIRDVNADILAVQEITHPQTEAISYTAEFPFVFGCARLHNGQPYGNAVFSRLPIISSENYNLSVASYEPRQCLRVSLGLTPSQPLQFFAVHLGTSIAERRHQARLLFSPTVLEHSAVRGARVIAGDFNEWNSGLATQLLTQHLKSVQRQSTFPAFLRFLHLDHVYYDSAFHLRHLHVHRTPLARVASDHLPLIAEFSVLPRA